MEWPPRMLCNGDDRGQWPKQGGAVGAAACKMRVPLQGTKQMQGAATRIFSAEISLFYLRFGSVCGHLQTAFFTRRAPTRLLPSPSVPALSAREPLAKPKTLTEGVRREKLLSSTTPFHEKGFWKDPKIFPEPFYKIFFL